MRNLLSSPPRRRGWPRLAAAALLLIATIADSRADTAPDPVAIKEILEHTVSGYAQPVSAAFAQQAKELATQTAATCRGGSAPLEGLRSTFRDLAAGWGRLSVARFGPLVADARLEKLAFWPDDRGAVRRQTLQLAAALPAGDAEAIAWLGKQSAAAQGLPAFDFLAFAPDVERNCRMAVAVAGNIARLAEEVADGFKDDAHLALLTPGPDNPSYPNAGEALAEVFRAMSTQAEVVRTIMILSPLGRTPDEAKPSHLFLRSATATTVYLAGAVDGLDHMFAAMALDQTPAGRAAHLGVDAARRELQTAREMVAALPADLAGAITDPAMRGKLTTAALALEGFNRAVNLQLAPAFGIRTGFNALDGD